MNANTQPPKIAPMTARHAIFNSVEILNYQAETTRDYLNALIESRFFNDPRYTQALHNLCDVLQAIGTQICGTHENMANEIKVSIRWQPSPTPNKCIIYLENFTQEQLYGWLKALKAIVFTESGDIKRVAQNLLDTFSSLGTGGVYE